MQALRIAVIAWIGVVLVAGLAVAQPAKPPEEVTRALEKMKKGAKLSPEEASAVKEWMTGAGGGPGALGRAGGTGGMAMAMETSLAGKTLNDFGMCPRVKVALPAKAADRGAYLAVVEKQAAGFAQADRQRAAAIDAQLGKPEQGAKLGGALLAGGDAAAALYVMARTAEARPDDPLIASNLGVLLTGKRELLDAQAALLWADARAPGSALITVNRAWLVYTAGDADGARALFDRARQLDAELAGPRVGLGLLAGCAGHPGEAADHLRAAAAKLPSKATTLALALAAPDDPAPGWKGSVPLALPPPPLSRDPANASADLARAQPILDAAQAVILQVGPGVDALMKESEQAFLKDGNPGMDVERYRSAHRPYQARVTKLSRQVGKDAGALIQRFTREGPPAKAPQRMQALGGCADDRCRKALEYQYCLEDQATLASLHPLVVDAIVGGWRRDEPAFVEDWDKSSGMLERLQSKAWSGVYGGALGREIVAGYLPYIAMTVSWATMVQAYNHMACVPPPPPPPPKEAPPPLPKTKLSELCDHLNFDIKRANWAVKVDCSSTTLSWSLPGATFAFKMDPLANETRVLFGMNAREGIVNVDSAVYVETANGLVNRVGGTFETSAGWDQLKIGLAGEGGFAAVEGGPPYDFKPFGDVWRVKPNLPGAAR